MRPRNLRDAPPRLLHRPVVGSEVQGKVPRPDRAEGHRPLEKARRQRRAHTAVIRLCVGRRD